MTNYEFMRWLTFFLMPTHLVTVRNDIKRLLKTTKGLKGKSSVLDVGGRKSPYTINLPAAITLLDVPQREGTTELLNLGFTDRVLTSIKEKRSNISDILIQDMTQSELQEASYDAVICVEVIEHVEADALFVNNIAKVIKTGGWAYFTTPNGDYIKNEGPDKNPDHIRHYTKAELERLLKRYFATVEVHYAVKTGKYRVQGLRGYQLHKPLAALNTMFSNIWNRFESKGVKTTAFKTAHLVAVGYK